jgi:lysophospholipase L1-like esterase
MRSELPLPTPGNPATTPIKGGEPNEPSDAPWSAAHARHLLRARVGEIDLLLIGDSITACWSVEGQPAWNELLAPYRPAEFGIGGDRTEHVLWRLQHGAVDGLKPRLVVLLIGTNNLGGPQPPQIVEGVAAILRELRERLPQSHVLLMALLPRELQADHPTRRLLAEANAGLARFADEQTTYVDLGPKYVLADGTLRTDLLPDLLHLSPAGYRIWAEAVVAHAKRHVG